MRSWTNLICMQAVFVISFSLFACSGSGVEDKPIIAAHPFAAWIDPPAVDQDGDGATAEVDCDDGDPRRAPGLEELCDGIDNNCNGQIDEGYDIDALCETGDSCQPLGRIRCDDDLKSSSCQFDDVGCI